MSKENVDIVDEEDKVIGKAVREEANEKMLRLRAARVIIFNNKNEILIHRRASIRPRYPDYWDIGVAEVLIFGESYESAAIRGLIEELNINGVSNLDLRLLFKLKYDNEKTKRWYNIFSLIYEKTMHANKDEVSEVRFVSEGFLNDMLKTELFVPAGLRVYEEYANLKSNKNNEATKCETKTRKSNSAWEWRT